MWSIKEKIQLIWESASKTLLDNLQADGLPPWEHALPNAMTTAELLSAILDTGGWSGAPSVNALVDSILSSQLKGYWTDPNAEDPWDVSSTAWVYWALRNIETPEAKLAIEQAAQWLDSVALTGGGFPTNSKHLEGNTYATAYAFRALSHFGMKEAATESLSYLKSCQNFDGGWGLKPGDRSEATLTCYVLHGLLDGNVHEQIEPTASALQWLVNSRSKDGTWGSWLNESVSVEGTAFALYVLSKTSRRFGKHELLGLDYIHGRVLAGEPWNLDGVAQNWMAITGIISSHCLRSRFEEV